LHRPIFGRPRGWVAARVTPGIVVTPSGRRVTFTVEPGARLDLEVEGIRSFRANRRVRSALGIDERLRLTRGFLEEADDRLTDALRRDGFLDATAEVALEAVDPHLDVLHVTVEQGARYRLKRGKWPNRVGVTFTGNETVPTGDLQAVLEQASEDVLRRGSYTPAGLDEGLRAAEDFYAAQGYQSARMTPGVPEFRKRRGWIWRALWAPVRAITGAPAVREVRLAVAVEEGPLTLQDEAHIVGAAPEVDVAELETELAGLAGQPFSPQRVEAVSRRALDLHREAGFLEADVRVVHTAAGEGRVASTVELTTGPQVLLRSVVTRGLRQIKPDFVRREVDLRLGEPLAFSEQQRVREDLYDLGAFRTVELTLLGDEAARDLVVGVTERAPWAFEAGGGLSTDQGTRLFGRITRNNLFYLPHRLEMQVQVGLDWLSDSVVDWRPDFRNPDFRAVATYRAPRFPGREQDLTLDVLFRERLAERTWRMARTGGGIGLEQHFRFQAASLDLRGAVRLETRQLQEVDSGALLPGEPWEAILAVNPAVPTVWRIQDSVTGLAVLDARDSPLGPTRGFLVQATGEYAPGALADALSDQPTVSFVKAGGRFTGYVPMVGLIWRVAGGAERAIGLQDGIVPLEDRFRLGGTTSLRGFARDTVGPRALSSRLDVDFPSGIDPIIDYALRDDATRWVPTGGDLSGVGTIELQIPWPAVGLTAWEGWAGALFADVGNVWLLSPDTTVTTNEPAYADLLPPVRTGVGLGVRVATPVGPLQLDGATNLQALTADGERRILLVEEWEEPRFRLHLSLGALW
ncbi:MAG: BamA/TamA family outer membrane protein, partial [Deltaproteobacteria bacterium]|nr:BamA/TamA family outer membrane protein [Deltaproteobacteria bacterium]